MAPHLALRLCPTSSQRLGHEQGIEIGLAAVQEQVDLLHDPGGFADASADGTDHAARNTDTTVTLHPYYPWQGASIKAGTRSAKGEIFMFLDARCQLDPADVPRPLPNWKRVAHWLSAPLTAVSRRDAPGPWPRASAPLPQWG